MKLFAIIFTLFPCIFLAVGGYLAHSQKVLLDTAKPVEATVLGTRVERRESRDSDGHRSVSYYPKVDFSYEVDGKTLKADTPLPMEMGSGRSWADGVVAAFKKGKTYTAYYNPADPSEAFLIHEAQFFPYIFILFPMLFVAVGLSMGIMAGGFGKRLNDPPLASGAQWFSLRPSRSIAKKRAGVLLIAGLWWGVGLGVAWHFGGAGGSFTMLPVIALSVYAAIGIVPAGMVMYYLWLAMRVSDAVVVVDRESFPRGEGFSARVEQASHRGLRINAIKVGLLCEETTKTSSGGKTTISTNKRYEWEERVADADEVQRGQTLAGEVDIAIPAYEPISSAKGYPKVRWFVTVHTDIAKGPDYKAKFPLHVVPGDPRSASRQGSDEPARPQPPVQEIAPPRPNAGSPSTAQPPSLEGNPDMFDDWSRKGS